MGLLLRKVSDWFIDCFGRIYYYKKGSLSDLKRPILTLRAVPSLPRSMGFTNEESGLQHMPCWYVMALKDGTVKRIS